VRGLRITPLSDLFHFLMRTAWSKLLAAFIVIYCGVNSLFATCYWLGGDGTILNARPGSFADAFWFSVQTFATIGYGNLRRSARSRMCSSPSSRSAACSASRSAPASFSRRFSLPKARVAFSKNILVSSRNGQPVLSFASPTGATALCSMRRGEPRAAGRRVERRPPSAAQSLARARAQHHAGVFLGLELIHRLDEKSPLFGLTPENTTERVIGINPQLHGRRRHAAAARARSPAVQPRRAALRRALRRHIEPTTPGMLVIDHSKMDELVADEAPSTQARSAPPGPIMSRPG